MPVRRPNHEPNIHRILGETELTNGDTNSVMVKSGKSFEQITGGEQTWRGCDVDVIFDIAASQSASLIELIEASTNHKPLSGR
jgi:hypothetical protein